MSPVRLFYFALALILFPTLGIAAESPKINAVMNAASYSEAAVSPGEMVVIFGVGLGPENLSHLRVGTDGKLVTEIDGVKVLANGIACPLIYVSQYQVSAMMPYGLVQVPQVRVEVVVNNVKSNVWEMPVAPSAPGIYTVDASGVGQAAMNNSDGTMNSPQAPAQRGNWITFYLTGEGQIAPAGRDGAIIWGTTSVNLPVKVQIAGYDAPLLYAGSAPGNVNGFAQVNAIVPSDLPYGGALPLTVQIGNVVSRGDVTVSVAGTPAPKPGTPQGLLISSSGSQGIGLYWQGSGAASDRFVIERRYSGSHFRELASVEGSTSSFLDTGANSGVEYTYRVRGVNKWGYSQYSNEAKGTRSSSGPVTPVLLSVASKTSNEVRLAWSNVPSDATLMLVEMNSGGGFTEVASTTSLSTFTVGSLNPATNYEFRVRAQTPAGISAYSNSVSVITDSAPAPNVQITVTPGSRTLGGSESQQFVANVTGSANTSVTWSFSPQVGSLSGNGLYTAPASIASAQSVTITARSVADTSKYATASVSLTPTQVPPVVQISVAPGSKTLGAGQSQQFTASVSGSANTSVTWSHSPQVGSLSGSGLYTAPGTVSSAQTVTITARGVADSTKSATATVSLSPTTPPPTDPDVISFWTNTVTPQTEEVIEDTASVTLGMKFMSQVPSEVVGVRFYKGPGNIGVHVGTLWTSSGEILGQVTFSNETAAGWQQANFPNPIPIAANTTYVVSYHAPSGRYAEDQYANWSGVKAPPLTVAGSSPSAFSYGSGVRFPTETWRNSNYWVDVAVRAQTGNPPPDNVQISLTPGSRSLNASESQQFTASVSGSTNTAVTWSMSPQVGTLSASGLYTAPGTISTSQTVTITARSVADTSKSASATVSLVPVVIPPPVTYSISGRVTGSSATLTLSGPSTATTSTDGSGNYAFSGLGAGLYVVAPSRSGYSFSPSTAAVTVQASSVTGVNFTGTAIPPAPRSVTLSWNSSTSSDVIGYNLYRATASGGPYSKLNSALISGSSFVDNNVVTGQTYYYVATAVDDGGLESTYSNQATAPLN